MSYRTGIQWTDATFNPWWGCTKVSPGCDHCYAENHAHRFGTPWGPGAPRRTFGDKHWNEPLHWNARAEREGRRIRVFCSSMADVFDNDAPPDARARLFSLIRATPHLDWQLLTKRIGNARVMLPNDWGNGYRNVWLGATIVNQDEAVRDIPKLLNTPAAIRFLSLEPLLGPIDLTCDGLVCLPCPNWPEYPILDPTTGAYECCSRCDHTGIGDEWAIDWVIVGGESGNGARPMNPQWVRDLRDQCGAAGAPFFFKQWGEWAPVSDADQRMTSFGKKLAGRLLDGVEHNAFPEIA